MTEKPVKKIEGLVNANNLIMQMSANLLDEVKYTVPKNNYILKSEIRFTDPVAPELVLVLKSDWENLENENKIMKSFIENLAKLTDGDFLGHWVSDLEIRGEAQEILKKLMS